MLNGCESFWMDVFNGVFKLGTIDLYRVRERLLPCWPVFTLFLFSFTLAHLQKQVAVCIYILPSIHPSIHLETSVV